MKTNKAFMILAALLALAGFGPVEPTARDVDELAMRHRSEAAAGYLAGRKGRTA